MTKKAKHLHIALLDNDGYLIRKSKQEDKMCAEAVLETIEKLKKKREFKGINIFNIHKLYNKDVVEKLKSKYPLVNFGTPKDKTCMMPDGGITFITDVDRKEMYPILIVEMKSQGTNDELVANGKSEQARGNAIERLGKNVIGLRTFMLDEPIFPFVCFGDGCDFDINSKSTIPDRVLVISMYGDLNKDQTLNTGPNGIFNRGSYYFRKKPWTKNEMVKIIYGVAENSIYRYFSTYGKSKFVAKKTK
jgi:type II restriction enzyme